MSYNPNNSNGQKTMANSAPVVIASDQSALNVIGTFYQATQPVSLLSLPSLAAGSNAIGSITNTAFGATQSGTWNIGTLTSITNAVTVSQSTATSLKTQAESYQGGSAVSSSNPLYVAQLPVTSGGLSTATGALTNTATAVSGSAGQVYGWFIYNPNNSVIYVQFYNVAAASVTVGTTSPVYSIGIPALSAANVFGIGVAHSTAIAIAATTTRSGAVAPGTNLDYNIFYK